MRGSSFFLSFLFLFSTIFFFKSVEAEISECKLMSLLNAMAPDLVKLCEDFKKEIDAGTIKISEDSEDNKNNDVKTKIVDKVVSEVTTIVNKHWNSISIEHEGLNLQEIITRVIRKFVATFIINKNLQSRGLTPTDRFSDPGCLCPEASFSEKILLILKLLDKVHQEFPEQNKKKPALVFTSLATGICFLEYLIVSELLHLGYKIETINFIDYYFNNTPSDEFQASKLFKIFTLMLQKDSEEFKKSKAFQEGIYPQKFNLFEQKEFKKDASGYSKNFLVSINYYTSAYHYVDVCEKNEKLKSHISLLVDPNPDLWVASQDHGKREFNGLEKGDLYLYLPSNGKVRLYKKDDKNFENKDFQNFFGMELKVIQSELTTMTLNQIFLNHEAILNEKNVKIFADPYLVFFDMMRQTAHNGSVSCFIARNKFGWASKEDTISPWEYVVSEPMVNKFDIYLKPEDDKLEPSDFKFTLASDFDSKFKADYEKAVKQYQATQASKPLTCLKESLSLLSQKVKALKDSLVAVAQKLGLLKEKLTTKTSS